MAVHENMRVPVHSFQMYAFCVFKSTRITAVQETRIPCKMLSVITVSPSLYVSIYDRYFSSLGLISDERENVTCFTHAICRVHFMSDRPETEYAISDQLQ